MSTASSQKSVVDTMATVSQKERIEWLHEQLKDDKFPNHMSLVEQFHVSPVIAYRDLDFLKYILKAPLVYDYSSGGYKYSKKRFKLPEVRYTEGELASLLVLGELRKAYEGSEIEAPLGTALELMTENLQDNVKLDQESLDQILQVDIEPFPYIDIKVFQDLLQAIRNNESIVIKYFSGQKAIIVDKPCDPYQLLNFKDNWYLVAFCHEKQDYRDFLCSRIMAVEHTNVTFLADPDFSLEQHKKESQLFASEAPTVEIVAEFDKYAAHWIRLKQVHPSQKVLERSDGSLEVSFKVSSMENIMRWILSFGEHARILAPLELQERVRRTIGRMNYLYNRF
ncbi:MAG: WYL domain-containing protein [Planctomycetales bacterium]|nr:WYL domain-containing protein [bacterium]UNM07019.1 MAG: WYL domain-containing protein [Planctomycetales bacterium]